MPSSRTALVAAVLSSAASSASAQVVYSNDFESGAGAEWSNPTTSATPGGTHGVTRYLGQFAAGIVTLSLGDQPAGMYELHHELFIIQSWDGNGPAGGGPDNFRIAVEDHHLLLTNFANFEGGNTQAYPNQLPPDGPGGTFPPGQGAAERNTLGFDFNGPMDAVYHQELHFHHEGGPLVITWESLQNQGVGDEGWGIDNLSVIAVPAPASVLVLIGAGLGSSRRRRA